MTSTIFKSLSFLLVCILAGCATQTEFIWVKPGSSSNDLSIDHGQCSAQAFSVPNAPLMQVAIVQNQCMRGKGWSLVERKISR